VIGCDLVTELVEIYLNASLRDRRECLRRICNHLPIVSQVLVKGKDIEAVVREDLERVRPVSSYTENFEFTLLLISLLGEGI
jgi:hypothetical protein